MADELIGLPEPPAPGASALPAGTFDGVTVFVTGGGTGLGKAIAAEFARLGASMVIASRKPEHLEAAQLAMKELGAPALTVGCDIRDAEQIAAAFDAAVAEFGLPGVLVNNAAANFPVPAEDMSPNAWRTVVDITLNGTFMCSREFGRRHIAAHTPGSIVNVGASYAWTGGPGFVHSAAAKAGVKNLTESLAVEWGPYGIQVNGLVPGNLTATPMSGSRVDLSWADNSADETSFKIYRSTDGSTWSWFASANANATAYSWFGGSPGTTYQFRVTATNATAAQTAAPRM